LKQQKANEGREKERAHLKEGKRMDEKSNLGDDATRRPRTKNVMDEREEGRGTRRAQKAHL